MREASYGFCRTQRILTAISCNTQCVSFLNIVVVSGWGLMHSYTLKNYFLLCWNQVMNVPLAQAYTSNARTIRQMLHNTCISSHCLSKFRLDYTILSFIDISWQNGMRKNVSEINKDFNANWNKMELLFISYKFVKGFLAITFLLLVFSNWNFHDTCMCQHFLCGKKRNFSWILQNMRNFTIDAHCKNCSFW